MALHSARRFFFFFLFLFLSSLLPFLGGNLIPFCGEIGFLFYSSFAFYFHACIHYKLYRVSITTKVKLSLLIALPFQMHHRVSKSSFVHRLLLRGNTTSSNNHRHIILVYEPGIAIRPLMFLIHKLNLETASIIASYRTVTAKTAFDSLTSNTL